MDISVTRFRASCLAVIRRVETRGEAVDIKRRGKVVARLSPPPAAGESPRKPWARLRGSGELLAEPSESVLDERELEASRCRLVSTLRVVRRRVVRLPSPGNAVSVCVVALSFNIAGSCVPSEHYMLSPALRLERVLHLIDEKKYFTLHAGHQTGKTTCARWLTRHYNESDRFRCLWVDVQTAREIADPPAAFRSILNVLADAADLHLPGLPRPDVDALLRDPTTAILAALRQLASASPRPLVVLFDEADGLIGAAMVSFLTQLRAGYLARGERPFLHAVALIGRKQVRDYALTIDER